MPAQSRTTVIIWLVYMRRIMLSAMLIIQRLGQKLGLLKAAAALPPAGWGQDCAEERQAA